MGQKKILIVMPKFPYPTTGACELDRAAGIEYFVSLGWEVQVITRVLSEKSLPIVEAESKRLGITIFPTIYFAGQNISFFKKIKRLVRRIISPWYWDGAAYEYTDPVLRQLVKKNLITFKPELVWFEYTYLWPLYGLVRKQGIPIVTRSHNFEPQHFLEEEGKTWFNYVKYWAKRESEFLVGKWSTVVASITPREREIYASLGVKNACLLPLRGLPKFTLRSESVKNTKPLAVYFTGSTYNVAHNRRALFFLLQDIIPKVNQDYPGEFTFHVFGAKIPNEVMNNLPTNTTYHGYVSAEELHSLLANMDIALVPSLAGAGMQQKVFEPLMRGFPTLTSPRALAGYDFKNNEHLLLATTATEYCEQLGRLRDPNLRARLSQVGGKQAQSLFGGSKISEYISEIIKNACHEN